MSRLKSFSKEKLDYCCRVQIKSEPEVRILSKNIGSDTKSLPSQHVTPGKIVLNGENIPPAKLQGFSCRMGAVKTDIPEQNIKTIA